MQAVNLQKKKKNNHSASEEKSKASSLVGPERNDNFETGVPLFLRQSFLLSTSQPPARQRQITEERDEKQEYIIQNKLTIGEPGDRYEQEADHIAEKVMKMPDRAVKWKPTKPFRRGTPCGPSVIEKERIQTKSYDPDTAPGFQSVNEAEDNPAKPWHDSHQNQDTVSVTASNRQFSGRLGHPLPESTREFFEPRFGYDFSDVRIHFDADAAESAKRLHARAFTIGSNIAFGSGAYAPQTYEGKKLIAHELTHVCQQNSGAVSENQQTSEPEVHPKALESALISSDSTQSVRRDLTAEGIWEGAGGRLVSGIAGGVRTVGSTIVGGVEQVGDLAGQAYESTITYFTETIENYAPGLMAILSGDWLTTIKERILDRLGGGFSRLLSGISREGLIDTLQSTFVDLATGLMQVAGELGSGACSALTSAARTLMDFRRSLVGGAIEDLRAAVSAIGGFFEDVWEQLGAPAVEAIGNFAGDVWAWIEEQATWVWEQTEPVRTAVIDAWQWLMAQFDISWNTAGDVLGWFREKAVEAWNEIMDLIEPVRVPLMVVGSALLLISPLGPFVLIGAGAYGVWYGLNWLWENWDDLEFVIQAREILHGQILPAISTGVQWLRSALSDAVAWFSDAMGTVAEALHQLMDALGVSTLLNAIREIVAFISRQFERMSDWVRSELVPIINEMGEVFGQVFEFIRPLMVVVGALLLLPTNPWLFAIVAAGWAWQILPDCLKSVVIDFVLDTMILVLEITPDFSTFGDAWATAKQSIIQLLTETRGMESEEKIEMADRIARVMTGQDIEWIGNLIQAARQMPGQFEGQIQQELIGMNLTQPLPFERTSTPEPSEAIDAERESGILSDENAALLAREVLADNDIEVDAIGDLQLDSEFIGNLELDENDEIEFGQSSDPSRSIAAIREELINGNESNGPEEIDNQTADAEEPDVEAQLQALMDQPAPQGCPTQAPSSTASQVDIPESLRIGPLTQSQRARYLMNQMWKGIRQWFSCNWQWLVPTIIGAIVALIILEIVTGGAVTAALPPLMEIVAVLFIGVAMVRSAYYFGEYLAKGLAGDIAGAARSLARGLAVAAIELVFALLFNLAAVLRSLRAGLRESLRAATRSVSRTARRTSRAVSRLGQTVAQGGRTAAGNIRRISGAAVQRGRLIMDGVGESIGQGVRNLDDFARRLWQRVRFRRFKIRRLSGLHFQLWGFINPWVLVATGEVEQVTVSGSRPTLGAEMIVEGRRKSGFLVGVRDTDTSAFVQHLNSLSRNQRRALYRELEGMSDQARRAYVSGLSATADNARMLRSSMMQGGVRTGRGTPKSGYAAHHIVPSTHGYGSAVEARQILDDLGININDGLNGVFVSPALHAPLHTHAYMDAVADALRGANRPQAIQILDNISARILANNFP